MQVMKLLHKFVSNALPEIHKTRREALICSVASLLDQGTLTLTGLGRNMHGKALVKHKIKRVDRLLNNDNLFSERLYVYKQLSTNILKNLSEAVILVDWSGCCSQERWILQASLSMSGRSIPIYSEIHPLKFISNPKVEKLFLRKLYHILPQNIKVIIVTDAGFKTPWFREIKKLGWHFVGRLRSRIKFNFGDGIWHEVTDFNNKIGTTPIYLGNANLGKTRCLMQSSIYGYKSEYKGRKKKRRKYCNDSYPDKDVKYGRSHKEPWILATSLPENNGIAKKIINIYKSRMQIEQNFRDLKNQRWGFALRNSKTTGIQRLEILLLISFIATMILWLLGVAAETQKLHYGFQANTKRNGRAISLFYLGWQIIKHGVQNLITFFKQAFFLLRKCHSAVFTG